MERETRFELATSTLARLHSTTELFPLLNQSDVLFTRGCPRSQYLVKDILKKSWARAEQMFDYSEPFARDSR